MTVKELQHHQVDEDGCCCGAGLRQLVFLLIKTGCENQHKLLIQVTQWNCWSMWFVGTNKQKQLDPLNKTRSATLPVGFYIKEDFNFEMEANEHQSHSSSGLLLVVEGRLSTRKHCWHCTWLTAAEEGFGTISNIAQCRHWPWKPNFGLHHISTCSFSHVSDLTGETFRLFYVWIRKRPNCDKYKSFLHTAMSNFHHTPKESCVHTNQPVFNFTATKIGNFFYSFPTTPTPTLLHSW